MKILHAAPPFIPIRADKGYGGIERVVLDLAMMQMLEHEVHVAAPKGTILPDHVKVHETVAPLGFFERELRSDYTALEHVRKVLEIAKDVKPDVVHCHDDYILPFIDMMTAPSILTLHSPYHDFWDSLAYNVWQGQRLVAISNRQKDIYEQNGFHVFAVVYNGVDTEKYAFEEEPDGTFFLSLSCVRPEKGQNTAIKTFDSLRKMNAGIDLILAGNIGDEAFFMEIIRPRIDYDISSESDKLGAYRRLRENFPKVFYAGEVTDSQKIPLYQRASVFIMPATCEESFGLVVAEAMSCGTPVVVSNKGALPELTDAETGVVVYDNDFDEAVIRAITFSRHACRSRVVALFSSERMSSNYEDLYFRLSKI